MKYTVDMRFLGRDINPGSDVQSDEALMSWIKQSIRTTFHTVGSCSMLPRDKGGVVDPQLKVYGTENVRVVDASIIPLHIGCQLQATVYAIAEQGMLSHHPHWICV